MPKKPDTRRRRLADEMDNRRRQLGLRWQDVADAGDLSLKTLYSARQPDGAAIAPLTQRKIEIGLRWEHGSVRRILDEGGDPVCLDGDGSVLTPLRVVPASDGDGTGPAERALASLVEQYPDDQVVQALAAQHHKPARMRVDEVLEWLEREHSRGTRSNGTAG